MICEFTNRNRDTVQIVEVLNGRWHPLREALPVFLQLAGKA